MGPVLKVGVIPLNPDGSPRDVGDGPLNLHMFDALLDTGATNACISRRVVSEVGLYPTGKSMMIGATGERETDEHFFGIAFVTSEEPQPTGEISRQLEVRPVRGMLFDNGPSQFDVLIGRDILCQGVFTMSFDGHFTLSF